MKTFEEALGSVAPHGEGQPAASILAAMQDRMERQESILEEIRTSSDANEFIELLLMTLPIKAAALTILANGVMIGMEMEKAE